MTTSYGQGRHAAQPPSLITRLMRTPHDHALLVARVVFGGVFFIHGTQKALGWFGGYGIAGTEGFFVGMHIPAPFGYLAIAAEFLGGLGLIVGLLGRVAAFGVACNMLMAVWLVHWKFGFFMNWSGKQPGEGFEFHLLALALAIVIMARGSGAWSADRLLVRDR